MVDFGVDLGSFVTSFDSFRSSFGGLDVDFVESSGAVGTSSEPDILGTCVVVGSSVDLEVDVGRVTAVDLFHHLFIVNNIKLLSRVKKSKISEKF